MKKVTFIYILILLLPVVALGRQDRKKHADSSAAQKAVTALKQAVTVSAEQEQQLFRAALRANENKRKVYEQYWKTSNFRTALAKTVYIRDSIYEQVLGKAKYLECREKLHYKQQQSELQQRIRVKRFEDSVTNKNKQP